ncbi:MAG: wax ester/triacylglycerol synthase family O-acyltransferase [Mycobacteriales bacterium]
MDASFLYIEAPTMPQHVLGVMLFDAAGSAGRFSVESFRAVLEERIHLLPAFERRLVHVPLHLDHPYWIHDPNVDLDAHLHRLTLPAPGDLQSLGHLVGEIGSELLPRDRPLWELWLVDGLATEQVALVAKMHHSTLYGAAGADMMAHLLDFGPEGREITPPPLAREETAPSTASLVARAALHAARRPVRAASTVVGSTKRLGKMGGMIGRAVTQRSPVTLPFTAPKIDYINGRLTTKREAAFTKVDFADIKTIKDAFGTKVNDVVLAAVTQSLSTYLVKRGALPHRPLVASVPMNIGAGAVSGTDKISALLVPLPVLTDDPLNQLMEVAEFSRNSKGMVDALGTDSISDVAELVPPLLVVTGSKLYDGLGLSRLHPPLQSLVVSNMPGPPIPLYCAGARVDAVYPFGPLLPGAGLNITVLSNMGNLDVGLLGCPDLVPDLWEIADGFPAAVAVLLAAARARKLA